MSEKKALILITRMNKKLIQIIENRDYDLLNTEVQNYSRRLDKVLAIYNRRLFERKKYEPDTGLLAR